MAYCENCKRSNKEIKGYRKLNWLNTFNIIATGEMSAYGFIYTDTLMVKMDSNISYNKKYAMHTELFFCQFLRLNFSNF